MVRSISRPQSGGVARDYEAQQQPPPPPIAHSADAHAGTLSFEFSHGAFRFGHAMVRHEYCINDLSIQDLNSTLEKTSASDPVNMPLDETWMVQWSRFFEINGSTPNFSRRIGPHLSDGLGNDQIFPAFDETERVGLLYRDLLELAREVAVEVRGPSSVRALLPPGRGRGSSVSSIVCYLTGLSHVDPVANDLSLGRFLNRELMSVPDIDLDFPRDIREVLIPRVHERYGTERSALVAARLRGAQSHQWALADDLRERVHPSWHDRSLPPVEEARRELALKAVRALGVTTARWVADYFRTAKRETLDTVSALAREGAQTGLAA